MGTVLYRAFSAENELLYVGISLRGAQRMKEHEKLSGWFSDVSRVDLEWFETRQSALVAEREAIIADGPIYNTHHNGKKSNHETQSDDFEKDEISFDVSGEMVGFSRQKLRPLYKLSEVADLLSVSTKTVRDWINNGSIGFIELSSHWRHVRGHEEKRKVVDYRISGWQILDFIDSLGGR